MDFKLILAVGLVIVIILAVLSLGFLSPAAQLQNANATAVIINAGGQATSEIIRANGDYVVDSANGTAIVRKSCKDTPYDNGCLPAGTTLVAKSQGIPPYIYFCGGGLIILLVISMASGTKFGE